eukprot:18194-Heterococcus_DN1.PRE.3
MPLHCSSTAHITTKRWPTASDRYRRHCRQTQLGLLPLHITAVTQCLHSRAAVAKLAPIAVVPDSTRTLVRCTTDSERCSSCRSVTAFLSVDSMSPLQTDV